MTLSNLAAIESSTAHFNAIELRETSHLVSSLYPATTSPSTTLAPQLFAAKRISQMLLNKRIKAIEQKKYNNINPEIVKVLLVDDSPIAAKSIHRLLAGKSDIEFYYCNDPQQAISMAIEIAPTVILQDLVMPNVDGLTMVKFFRANPATRLIPIVILSNQEESIVKAKAFSLGVNDYLIKLPDPIELIARLRYHSTAYINQAKVACYNQELEGRVAERTSELEKTVENLKQTHAKLIQKEKMASLGQLVAGVAHEINNPINFISGNIKPAQNYAKDLLDLIELYQQECPQLTQKLQTKIDEIDLDFIREDFIKLLDSLKMGANRIRSLVVSLRNFSHLDKAEKKMADIHDGIDNTLLILGSKLKNVRVVRNYENCPMVECFPGQLNQVFMNILANAADAVEEKRQHSQQSENCNHIDYPSGYQPEIIIRSQTLDDRWIQVTIADNGLGIPEDLCDRIFEPFFTTKPVGKGTGLGLSISYQIIVEKHGGTIDVAGIPGRGTTFRIKVPRQILSH
ncbi:MAG: response regulator [Cyanobacteria bacterium SBLK]|nr:response regulator [Cyanobacteria bacterium SBLK]